MFTHYERLIEKIDRHLESLPRPACPAGCSACCRAGLSVFPVEAFYLRRAFLRLPAGVRERARRADSSDGGDNCVLLVRGRCILYAHRPVLCRTHGYPFVTEEEGDPDAWQVRPGCEVLPDLPAAASTACGSRPAVLQLDRVNEMLVAVNGYFLRGLSLSAGEIPVRIPIGRVLAPRDCGEYIDAHL